MKKIFVADDNDGILDMLRVVLEAEGFEVIVSEEPEDIFAWPAELPDLIILDIWMSGVDGRDICKQLKNGPRTKKVPVLLMSANNEVEQMANDAGADGFIAKPFEISDFLEKCVALIG
ncbi:response regulator transcription factor [Sphingobacterium paludis]|uniref:Two-component system cell cycle response regulator DivK n=1 Tax=Sphingobacterium paludis TaxID=1476465 RepID=A0A4V3E1A9_9SPHI|nr:response regulator transcription factor [Sphingobacterium paludis]TDS12368.1 two-component system cell cycle response regulator DivK [Sphingobacterium paludis]